MDNRYTEITKDLEIIEDLFCETEEDYEKLFRQIDLSREEFEGIKSGELEPDKIQLENIYNFAYNHNLYLNEITWLESEDEYKSGNISVNSHGAHTSIQGEIKLDNFAANNDFSFGFYLGEDISQAGMWVANDVNSSLYIFTFDNSGLQEARFNVSIDWMLAILLCRDKLDKKYLNNPRIQEIKSKIDNCDYVYAPISDNNLFEVIDAFAAGEITDLQCLYAISATHLGYQVVIKTQKALQNIDMKKHLYFCSVEKSLYNKESDIESNTAMNKALIAKKRYSDVGKYINQLLGEIDD